MQLVLQEESFGTELAEMFCSTRLQICLLKAKRWTLEASRRGNLLVKVVIEVSAGITTQLGAGGRHLADWIVGVGVDICSRNMIDIHTRLSWWL